ncbi:MAG: phosphatase PAP2 family protein [Parvibaculum sp.]|uniref:phosphatase PAP2 family protein n=1 Tax=Parvibaculum sp. TaxID=2024848 RepID=UPI0025D1423F|nr:phosphatase PAP2 family protein [Parvibaculum sp.]MCE9648779.1 phosphatase PAP2 family protein [Parvibaculum sp.]
MLNIRHMTRWTGATFPHPSPAAWVALAAVPAVDLIWSIWGGFHVSPGSIKNLTLAAFAMSMLVGFAVYGRGRDDLKALVTWASATLFVIPFSIACVVLSYLVASIDLPLVDVYLSAFDRTLGFNWIGLLEFVNAHPYFGQVTTAIYYAAFPELALLILFLAFIRRAKEVRELVDIYWKTLLLTIVFSALFPALDPVGFYAPSLDGFQTVKATAGSVYLPDYLALRAGTYDTFDFGAMQGIIEFPSFHAALALMMTWSVRRLPWLLVIGLVFNGLMLVATLTEGGHYLADVVTGSLLVVAAIWLRHRPKRMAETTGPLQALRGFD